MATLKHPNQNFEYPIKPEALAAARARLAPPSGQPPAGVSTGQPAPSDGKSGRRQIRPGEWVDDRKIVIDGPATPSQENPPEARQPRTPPQSFYDPAKVYTIRLFKSVPYLNKMLPSALDYTMTGDVCAAIWDSIDTATELGPIPVDPSPAPSSTKA